MVGLIKYKGGNEARDECDGEWSEVIEGLWTESFKDNGCAVRNILVAGARASC